MYHIEIKDEKYKSELIELVKVFLSPADFSVEVDDNIQTADTIQIKWPDDLTDFNAIKRYYYDELKTQTGYEPPWGILIGVRPVKKVNEYIASGWTDRRIRNELVNQYYLREDKVDLLLKICNNQQGINKISTESMVGIYIGIPFCPSRCSYCSFASNQADEVKMQAYIVALYKEIDFVSRQLKLKRMFPESIYIGGGTPTALSDRLFDGLLDRITASFDWTYLKEFTVEAGRPDSINEQKLSSITKHRVNRISINPQSMHQRTLDKIGRVHTPGQIVDAFRMARAANIQIINADIIAGLPEEDLEDFVFTLESILSLVPENITIHTLALKRASKLNESSEEKEKPSRENPVEAMLVFAERLLTEAGYEPYYLYRQKQMTGNFENVGYTRKGYESIYNVRIMEEKQTIIALGAGGISKHYFPMENRHERIPNVSNLEIYIDKIDEMIQRKKDRMFQFMV
jgi:coproporphyrinogen dehydrogenase HemZ